MVIHRAVLAPVLALVLATGCSKGGAAKDDGKVASCNMPTMQSCREYRGGNLTLGTESLAKLCTTLGSFTFSETPCPTAGVIGVCAMNEGTDFYYTGYEIPMERTEKRCTEGGHTFRAK
jgi:hypothetical protein